MAKGEFERRLAAIVAADVAGFSRLVAANEEGTLSAMQANRSTLIDPKISEYGGRIANTAGDSLLLEFPSAVNAVRCAIDIQFGLAERNIEIAEDKQIRFRIGINVGDVIDQDGDLLGDGVNVAARLEGLAEPGGIYVARNVRDQIRDKLALSLTDLGEVEVKNIKRPVRAFQIQMNDQAAALSSPVRVTRPARNSSNSAFRIAAFAGLFLLLTGAALFWWQPWTAGVERASTERMKFPLPAKPSIAVLPFTNLSTVDSQEFFADGITVDIITDLSKISGIFVAAHQSTLGYRGKTEKVRHIAEELGVRYVLSGSVRRADNKLRITAQLDDAIKGNNLWSDRYDRDVKDIFAVQSEVTRNVVKAMAVTLKAREHDRIFQKYVSNIEAYDAWQRARAIVEVPAKGNIEKGEALFKQTIKLDPKFAGGYAGLSFNYAVKARFGYSSSKSEDIDRALALARQAIDLDPNFAWSHIAFAGALLADGKYDAAVDAMQEAVKIQPGGFETNLFMGFYLFRAGQSVVAVKHLEIAENLSRIPTFRGLAFLGIAYFMDGQYGQSEATWKKAAELIGANRHVALHVYLAAAQIAQGKTEDAAETVARFRRMRPEFKLSDWPTLKDFKSAEFKQRLVKLAVKAGIPE